MKLVSRAMPGQQAVPCHLSNNDVATAWSQHGQRANDVARCGCGRHRSLRPACVLDHDRSMCHTVIVAPTVRHRAGPPER